MVLAYNFNNLFDGEAGTFYGSKQFKQISLYNLHLTVEYV